MGRETQGRGRQTVTTIHYIPNSTQYLNLKGTSDAHFPQVGMILLEIHEKSIIYFG